MVTRKDMALIAISMKSAIADKEFITLATIFCTRPHSAVSNVSGYRCVSDCRSRGREFDPGPVPYFRGD